MRGVKRSNHGRKIFSPLKLVLFGVIFCILSNVFPSSAFDGSQFNKLKFDMKKFAWSDIQSYARKYTEPVRVNYFEEIRTLAKSYIGFDLFYVLFNLFRLVLACVMKDYIIDFLPFSKSKSVGQKLITSMRSQLDDAPDSEAELDNRRESEIDIENRKQELGIAGYYSSKAVFTTSSAIYTLVSNILKNAKMLVSFIYYTLRMVGLTIFMILQIPKQLVQGFYTGLLDTGVIHQSHGLGQLLDNLPSNLGVRQIFLDSIVELFHTSDLSDEEHLLVTGMPTNRNIEHIDSSDHECEDGECKICDATRPPSVKPTKPRKSPSNATISSCDHLKQLNSWKESISQ